MFIETVANRPALRIGAAIYHAAPIRTRKCLGVVENLFGAEGRVAPVLTG